MADRLRLLICHDCESIEELPFYEGPPDRDDTLAYRVSFHQFPNGEEHLGVLATVPADHWEKASHRHEIVEKIATASGRPGTASGLGADFYDVKNNFAQDAMACWKKHNRTNDCDEWRGDHKRLYPDTKGDRKELGLNPKGRPNTFLCDFCPVTSVYAQKRNDLRGDYN
jgi:hypothetical protein